MSPFLKKNRPVFEITLQHPRYIIGFCLSHKWNYLPLGSHVYQPTDKRERQGLGTQRAQTTGMYSPVLWPFTIKWPLGPALSLSLYFGRSSTGTCSRRCAMRRVRRCARAASPTPLCPGPAPPLPSALCLRPSPPIAATGLLSLITSNYLRRYPSLARSLSLSLGGGGAAAAAAPRR
jgi:hypothetical protein